MFSLENFYYIVYNNLLKPANIIPAYYSPFGSTEPRDLCIGFNEPVRKMNSKRLQYCLFYDQEPISVHQAKKVILGFSKSIKLLANSEYSKEKKDVCRDEGYQDWYYFFHGFAALAWYRDYRYIPMVNDEFKKPFISLNRLVTNDRSYRLTLVSHMLERNLVERGLVSLSLHDHGYGTWISELADPRSKLTEQSKTLIERQLSKLNGSLVVDHEIPKGSLSADSGPLELALNQSALWHVVSETVFYYDKLHLTEKVFKPIVSRRPFLLVAAPGNLEYLKRYGFKTFNRWVDESYDLEQDNDRRIEKVIVELEKICRLSDSELRDMHAEMREILDFNYHHFYGDFKKIIVREMIENFQHAAHCWNHARVDGREVDIGSINFDEAERIFLS